MTNPVKGAYPIPIQAPTKAFAFVDVGTVSKVEFDSRTEAIQGSGALSDLGMSCLNEIWAAVNGANMIIPCSVDQTSVNLLLLSPLVTSPVSKQNREQHGKYTVFSTWAFCANSTSTGLLTASVTPLDTLKVYKNNGGTQATSGDIVLNRQYFLTYVDSLDSNNGGFVLR